MSEEFVLEVLISAMVVFVPSEQRAAHSEPGLTRRARVVVERKRASELSPRRAFHMFGDLLLEEKKE